MTDIKTLTLLIVLFPLAGSIITGLGGKVIGRQASHWVANVAVGLSFLLSLPVFWQVVFGDARFDGAVYTWLESDGFTLSVGFLLDPLTAIMMLVVTFVSFMVHIYTIGYMADDPGYQRFFSYINLFTFSMLMLVTANNFLQLFFGWEAVGLVSYLLIGFWYKRESAIYANLKAFLVNRVGDFGFALGIALILTWFGSLDYSTVFQAAPGHAGETVEVIGGQPWSLMSLICILLFVGAMGKSAQVPLHVWLPDSMEGPTPISALIHAATMVTAGIFMVARMSPLFELSDTALSVVMVIGATTAFFMGLVGIVQHDIKRVIAYSTLSQLGYMFVALGASAYAVGIFHLMTHAFFKALLFLAAGSVIIALHHEQDMRRMGGLRKYMPITWLTSVIGTLALIGFPGFSGFYSKDSIIEAVALSHLPGAGYAHACVLLGVFVTSLYSFRLLFLVFHGEERIDPHAREHLHESPAVVTVPLILLAIPSVLAGMIAIGPMLHGGFFEGAIFIDAQAHPVMTELEEEFHGALAMMLHGFFSMPFLLLAAGFVTAWFLYLKRPDLPGVIATRMGLLYRVLVNKYGFDDFNDTVVAGGARGVGSMLWGLGDRFLIDGLMVNGSARVVGACAAVLRHMQTGYLYHYAFVMFLGLLLFLGWFVNQ
ncbi:MAG: NADH-quinone oxidoreductase subunit L [Gammaproteobacteria bacterium]|nr:MAG: NADH-quinone oxidoreductase subunit L [Gammaproteobacteria bacterium]